jgi:hypothetical protein
MRKMILLAAMTAIAALMMAAAPALGQDQPFIEFDGVFVKPGDCGSFPGQDRVPREDLDEFGITEDEIAEEFPGSGPMFFCVFEGEEPPQPEPPKHEDKDDDDRDGRDRDGRDRDGRDNVADIAPVFEITQDLEQEAESGDIDQSFDVSQTGDNSNQTVGIQGVANTGNAQNQIGVIDAGGFGDFDGNNDNDRFFVRDNNDNDDFCDDDDRFFFDFCDDNNNHNDDGDFCDFVDCDDNDNDLCDVFGGDFCDNDNNDHGFFIFDDDDNDRVFGDNDGSDFEFEDVGSTIEVSPTNTTSSDQQVNQAATAFGK